MKKRFVVITEGNSRQIEQLEHQLNKLTDQANAQPELVATLQSERVEQTDTELNFSNEHHD